MLRGSCTPGLFWSLETPWGPRPKMALPNENPPPVQETSLTTLFLFLSLSLSFFSLGGAVGERCPLSTGLLIRDSVHNTPPLHHLPCCLLACLSAKLWLRCFLQAELTAPCIALHTRKTLVASIGLRQSVLYSLEHRRPLPHHIWWASELMI